MNNTITQLFGIKYPLIQAGMIWCSGWELASASKMVLSRFESSNEAW